MGPSERLSFKALQGKTVSQMLTSPAQRNAIEQDAIALHLLGGKVQRGWGQEDRYWKGSHVLKLPPSQEMKTTGKMKWDIL